MAAIPGLPACIDRWEGSLAAGVAMSRAGTIPESAASWVRADAACRAAGRRLCTAEEWERACRGAAGWTFPYGNTYDPLSCNGIDRWREQSDAAGVVATGSLDACRTPQGVFDLSGNVWEWTTGTDPTGTLRELRGGGYGNREDLLGCVPRERLLQPPDEGHSAYGFRCCASRPGGRPAPASVIR